MSACACLVESSCKALDSSRRNRERVRFLRLVELRSCRGLVRDFTPNVPPQVFQVHGNSIWEMLSSK